jgi:hypothetical protein
MARPEFPVAEESSDCVMPVTLTEERWEGSWSNILHDMQSFHLDIQE